MSKPAGANSSPSSSPIQIGDKFGRLTVQSEIELGKQGHRRWTCICDCGNIKIVSGADLRRNDARATRSCGCLRIKIMSAGDRYGRLVVLQHAGKNRHSQHVWLCQCDCGTIKPINGGALRSGTIRSCGCFQRDNASRVAQQGGTHGATRGGKSNYPAEYRIWCAMLARCYNPNVRSYRLYGGRGITVCEQWRESYESFLANVGRRPSAQHSLDRYPDKDGNYEPGNVRWATSKEQARNTRKNVLFTINDETRCLTEWSEISGIPYSTLRNRWKAGWDMIDMLRPASPLSRRRRD